MRPSKEHLDKINSRLAGHTMTESSVEVLPFLVFNTEQTDRYTIMSKEMLAKMAQDLNEGKVAFNSLHRSNSSLPVGSSISGRIVNEELQAMMYAVTKRPDGTVFEEGKDLADRYATGAVRACSAGVRVGFYKCNICGNDIRNWSDCDHIPGKTYAKDEEPITCIALMTGHEIVDGIAQDCGIYEVSAVTAGGVAAAGTLTEAFGAYEEGVDVSEFKKSITQEKQPSLRVEFTTAPTKDETLFSQEEESMDKLEIEKMLQDHYDPLKQELDKLKADAVVKADEFTAVQEQFTTATAELETATAALETVNAELETAKAYEPYKAAYLALVAAQATKAGEEVTIDTYADKSIEDCEVLLTEYATKIAALPDGQQLEGGEQADTSAALNESFYKV